MIERRLHIEREINQVKEVKKTPDQLIWNSFKEGSREAFQYIYDQNFNVLLQYGMKIVPEQSFVEDNIQDFFIYLWRKKENLEVKTSITVYLIWSLRNRLIKAVKVEKKLTSDKGLELIEDDSITNERLSAVELKGAVDSLPDKQREAVYLKYYQNLDGEDISRIMDITIGTTYNLLSRAIANLRKTIPTISLFLFFLQQI